jgi:hypothetical protein
MAPILKIKTDKKENTQKDWHQFLDKFAGILADGPIKRGSQGNFEVREN